MTPDHEMDCPWMDCEPACTCEDDTPYTCQGCGAVRYGSRWRDRAHNCWRNQDGTYEEGGTFQ